MRSRWRGVVAAAACLLYGSPAWPQVVPTIAGDYVSSIQVHCQPVLGVDHSGGTVASLGLGNAGSTTYSIALDYYDPRIAIWTSAGWSETGSPVLSNDDINGRSGAPFSEAQVLHTGFYSNTATTVTLDGIVYQAIWGRLVNTLLFDNVPQFFTLTAIDSEGCVTIAEKVRRTYGPQNRPLR